ncbi:MAG: hypothetical protein Q9212_004583 [Teloschistes hypoglaucus]
MPPSLPSLPKEILLCITRYLNSEADYLHFSKTHPVIACLLGNKHTIGKALKRTAECSDEVRRVEIGCLSPWAAMQSIYQRKNAVAAAQPVSCVILGQATTFLYRQGQCAYVRGNQIRVLDVHSALDTEAVIDCSLVAEQLLEVDCLQTDVELYNLQCGLLTIAFHGLVATTGWNSWLLVIDVDHYNVTIDRFIFMADLTTREEMIVRNNEKHLCLISPFGVSANGRHREWVCKVLDVEHPTSAPLLLQIPDLVVGDIGRNVVFEIFGEYLYIVSTQAPHDLDEPEWVSYYRCYRLPLENPHLLTLEKLRSWRRNHSEGPINDPWTSLSLQQDESSGDLVVIEARKEWTGSSSAQRRTWYKHVLPSQFTSSKTVVKNDENSTGSHGQNNNAAQASLASSSGMVQDPPFLFAMPPNEAARDAEASAAGMVPGQRSSSSRIPCHVHSEYPANGPMPAFVNNSVLAKSKHRTYELRAQAFIDLVVDDREPHRQSKWKQQIRLRIGSRREISPLNDEGMVHSHLINRSTGKAIQNSELRYQDTGIHLWPPIDAPMVLQDLLNGGDDPRDESKKICRGLGDVSAISDERSILYLVKEKQAGLDDWGRLILINFDQHIRFQHEEWSPSSMNLYGRKGSAPAHPSNQPAEELGEDGVGGEMFDSPSLMNVDDTESNEESSDSEDGLNPAPGGEDYDLFCDIVDDEDDFVDFEWFTQQMALWTEIRQGFQFS